MLAGLSCGKNAELSVGNAFAPAAAPDAGADALEELLDVALDHGRAGTDGVGEYASALWPFPCACGARCEGCEGCEGCVR